MQNLIASLINMNIGEETEQIEFKRSTGELKEAVISIASILNKHESGDLYFGVKNNGDVIGQEIGETTLRTVGQTIRTNIKPAVYPVIEKKNYGDCVVIHVHFEGRQSPYLAYGIPRIRVADEDTQMDQELYREMLNARASRVDSWESQLSKYHIGDIDSAAFESYLQRAKELGRISFEHNMPREVLNKLGLAQDDVLLNAGAALFVDSDLNELQLARFVSDERLTFIDAQRLTGSLLSLADQAVNYVVKSMDWRFEFDGSMQRKEYPEVPVEAIREAVINAFAHRVIESMQAVDVAIYKNYIDICSMGMFPAGVTPEQFITQARKPIRRNPRLTRALYYSKDMEGFATGLKRIHETCTQAGVKVEFVSDEYGFTVRFHRHCGAGWQQNEFQKDRNRAADDSGSWKVKLRNLIGHNPLITSAQLAASLGIGQKAVEGLLNEMADVYFTGAGHSGHWERRVPVHFETQQPCPFLA